MQPELSVAFDGPMESACTFGKEAQLAGVYTPGQAAEHKLPCALFLTAGLLHHVGPHRLHVETARELAKIGAPCLRFDLAGVGDSETRSGDADSTARSVEDVKLAMDQMTRDYGHQRFVLIGLCSGADDALATALKDDRVVGAVLLNGYAYRTEKFPLYRFMNFYLPRLFMLQKWVNRTKRLFQGATVDKHAAATALLDDDYRYIPPQEDTAAHIRQLTSKGTQLFFIYTGSEHEDYSYKDQLFDMFPSERGNMRLREQYLKEADHTFVLKADRLKITNWIRNWYLGVPFKQGS